MIGTTISHYKILSEVGRGGMGVVYKAEDMKLERTVALKFLAPHAIEDPEHKARFVREAKAAARLDHQNICPIHEIDEADGQLFLAMTFLEGQTLKAKIAQRPLKLDEALDIAVQTAQGLQAAHQNEVVHRDIKPANLMLTEQGQVKIMDFGLAQLADRSQLTKTTTMLGTPAYMSPEQAQRLPTDRRTDIWSLGVVIYEMVTGRLPFAGERQEAVLYAIANEEPEPITALRAGLPMELDRIVAKAMAKEPGERYPHVDDLLVDLRALQKVSETTRVMSPPAAPAAPFRRWIVAGALGLLTLGFGAYLFWHGLVPSEEDIAATRASHEAVSDQKMIVVLPFANLGAPEDEYFADGMTEEIISRLAALDGLGVISRTSAMQYKESPLSLRQIGEELGVDYVLEGTVRWQRSASGPGQVRVTPRLIRVAEDTHLWADRYTAVLADIFEVQSDIAKQVIEKLDIVLLEPQRRSLESQPTENLEAYNAYLRGNDYLHRGREVHSRDEVEFAIQMYEEALQLDPGFALAHARQSTAHAWLYFWYFDRTEARLALAKEAADRALELDPGLPEAHYALGVISSSEGDWDRALDEYQIVLKSQPSNVEVFEQISEVQSALGQWEESLTTLRTAMKLDLRFGSLACWAGGRSLGLRDFSEAIRSHDRAIQLTPDRSCPYYCKALIYLNWDGSTERARRFLEGLPPNVDLEGTPPINYDWVIVDMIERRYQEALRRLSSGSSEVYEFVNFYVPKDRLAAQIHGLMNRPALEQAHYEEARDPLEAKVEEQPKDHRMHSSLGIAFAGLGRRDDAIREGRLGIELLAGNRDASLGFRLKDLAQIYVMVGEYDEAIGQLEHLLSVPAHFSAPYLKADPTWNPLRSHPGFLALLEKHGATAVPLSPAP